jgi:hypothetical protein
MNLASYLHISIECRVVSARTYCDAGFVFHISKILVMQQKTKYRIGVMNVREQRRQGILEKNCDKAKSFGSSHMSSISSVGRFESLSLFFLTNCSS